MKKLTKKQIMLIAWIVIITAMCVYAFYFFVWGISKNFQTIQTTKNNIVAWQSAEPNEERSAEFIEQQIQMLESILKTTKEMNTKFLLSTLFTFAAYVSFVISFLLAFFRKNNQCYNGPSPPPPKM